MTVAALSITAAAAFLLSPRQAVRRERPDIHAGRPLTNEELCDLVESIASARDRRAFTALFAYFAPRLKGFAIRRGADASIAEELAQETMLTVWRKAHTFDRSKATVWTWMFTIVRNKRIDLARRRGYPETDLSKVSEVPAEVVAADDALQGVQVGTALHAAMRLLPKEQRQIIEKAFFEDKSHRVIAEELGLPLGTVKSRVRLALARLRGALPEAVHD
jgi:RNA polymerase sigma-70 factor (ECF subfamily)